MSKTISFRGQLPIGEQDRIRLKTSTGKTGYKITKFQIMIDQPGVNGYELLGKIFLTDQTGNIDGVVNFSDSDLVAVAYIEDNNNNVYPLSQDVIFDNVVFNQDVFIYIVDQTGSTNPANYYIEMEAMSLTDLETTKLTLQSIRQVTAP